MTTPKPKDRYRITARSTSDGIGVIEAKESVIDFDRSWAQGVSDLPGPAELLCAAFAACVIKNVERFSKLLPFAYEEVEIEVEAHRQDRPPRFDRIEYVVRIVTNEPEARVDLLARNLAKHGTVFNTLAAGCTIEGKVIPIPIAST
jgi:uncharacterized OsmC-like protein